MSPGAAATRSATSRWTISTMRRGRGCLAQEPVQDGAGDVVRDVGDHVVRLRGQVHEVLVQRVALHDPQGAGLELRRERLAQHADEAAVQLHGGDSRAGREEPAGQEPEARADLQDVPPRHRVRPRAGSARGCPRRRGSSATGCGAPAGPRRAGAAGRSAGRVAGRSRGSRRSSGERQRRPRVQVQARPHARGEAPGPGGADHRAVVRCTGPGGGSPSRCRAPPPGR